MVPFSTTKKSTRARPPNRRTTISMLSFKIPTIPKTWVEAANHHLAQFGVELDSAFVGRHAETISWAVTLAVLLVVVSVFFPPKKSGPSKNEIIRESMRKRGEEAAERHRNSPVKFSPEELRSFDVSLFRFGFRGMLHSTDEALAHNNPSVCSSISNSNLR